MDFPRPAGERAAHREPHDLLRPLGAAEPDVVGVLHRGERLRVTIDQLEKARVPLGVVEAGALAVQLVREPAGADHDHLQVLRVGLDRAPHRLAELVAAPRRGDRVLEHVDLDRHDLSRPVGRGRPEHRERRMAAVIDRQLLEHGEVEFLVHERLGHVAGERRVALQRRHRPRPEALVGDGVLRAHAQREGRVVVEEEGRRVVVVEEHQHVGLAGGEPRRDRLVALEQRSPVGILALAPVVRHRDRGDVGGADAADDSSHKDSRLRVINRHRNRSPRTVCLKRTERESLTRRSDRSK